MVISVNPPRSSCTLLDGKDVLRQTHSPRVLSKSIEARYSPVSYLNTGNGLSAGHAPARINFISARCTGDVSPAVLMHLGQGTSISSPLAAPLSVGRILSDQLPSSAVVTLLSVVNPKPRAAGLVACLRPTRPGSGHVLSHTKEQLAIPFLGLGEQTAKLGAWARVSDML